MLPASWKVHEVHHTRAAERPRRHAQFLSCFMKPCALFFLTLSSNVMVIGIGLFMYGKLSLNADMCFGCLLLFSVDPPSFMYILATCSIVCIYYLRRCMYIYIYIYIYMVVLEFQFGCWQSVNSIPMVTYARIIASFNRHVDPHQSNRARGGAVPCERFHSNFASDGFDGCAICYQRRDYCTRIVVFYF